MKDLMIDIQTLGTTPGCVILSIGAVFFDIDSGKLGKNFYSIISQDSCRLVGLKVEQETLKWWNSQSVEAKKLLEQTKCSSCELYSIRNVLLMLNQFIITNSDSETVRVWGNGSNFDNVILEHTYRLLNIKPAWKNQNDRCFRTLKKIYPEMKIERCGTYHNALDDAITQAKHAIKIYGRINRMNKVAKIGIISAIVMVLGTIIYGILGLSVALKDISEYKF